MKNVKTVVLDHLRIQRIIDRFAHQLIEDFHQEKSLVIVGIAGRGSILANRITKALEKHSKFNIIHAEIKIDKNDPYKSAPILSIKESEMEGKVVFIIDDVLNSGRTLMHSLCYVLKSRVKQISTIILVDRIHRKFPVRADYVGLTLSTNLKEHVTVEFTDVGDLAYLS